MLFNALPRMAQAPGGAVNLNSLVLRKVGLGPEALPSLLGALRSCPDLAVLELAQNRLGLTEFQGLCQSLVEARTPLECLILSHNPLAGQGGGHALETLLQVPSMRYLRLDACGLEAGQVEAISRALVGKVPLTYLNLAGNRLGDAAALLLAQALRGNTNLEELDLGGNTCSEAGFKALLETLREHPSLAALNLRSGSLLSVRYQEEADRILRSRHPQAPDWP